MKNRRAFAIVEVAAGALAVGALLCVLLVCSKRSRGEAWQAGSLANLHEFATVTASYAADNTDLFWSYSWPGGERSTSTYPDLQDPADTQTALSFQLVDMMRRRGGLPNYPATSTLFPPGRFHALVLADYLETALPLRFTVSPGDKEMVLVSNDIPGFERGDYFPFAPTDPVDDRWPFASSYRVPMAFFSPDAVSISSGTICPAGFDSFSLTGPDFFVGRRRTSEVSFPSQKVHVYDSAQWGGVKSPVFFAYSFARVPLLMVDGSAHVRPTGDANSGFHPNNPRYAFPVTMTYSPLAWDPQPMPNTTVLPGSFAWTRGGLKGRDFEGLELDTTNW